MEAAAIALTCASHAVPFLTIKDISNNEQRRLSDSAAFKTAVGEIGRRAAALVMALLTDLEAGAGS